ncbi:MAG: hypothetical protein KA327_10830 [Pseudarcicella sp.]|nr:hypothetical protein [Pseudarcicella sp.]
MNKLLGIVRFYIDFLGGHECFVFLQSIYFSIRSNAEKTISLTLDNSWSLE